MKILIIDDHALFRDGLKLVLEDLDTDINVFEAGSYETAKIIIDEKNDIDLVLLDLGLPEISYIDALIAIRQQLPDSHIVILSGTEDYSMIERALQNGARGYIPKSSSAKIMLNALQLVISGGIYVPPEILQNNSAGISTDITDEMDPGDNLTPRQRDVLRQLADGKSNREIGNVLNLTESTVRAHVAAILKTFNVSNRTQAVQHAMQKSWLKINV